MNRPARNLAAALALASAALVCAGNGTATAGPDRPYCSLTGMTVYAWDGGGDGTSWSDADNWVDGAVPGTDDIDDAYVCIPPQDPGAPTITMSSGDVATVQVFEAPLVRLVIEPGAGLFVYGDQELRPSIIGTTAAGSQGLLTIRGAFGGPGLVEVRVVTFLGQSGEDDSPDVPATFTSDPCPHFAGLPPAACGAESGRIVHHLVNFNEGGFDLLDGYDFVMLRTIYNSGGIGLGPGSRLELGSADVPGSGQSLLLYGGDIYPVGAGSPRPVVVNEGKIVKVEESGSVTSTISTRYEGDGIIAVGDGHRLIIEDRAARPAEVTATSEFGSGPCRRVAGGCRFATLREPGRRQSALFRAPRSQPTSQPALVRVVPRPDLRLPGHLGHPYRVHAGALGATESTPAVIELRFDSSLLRGRTWRGVDVLRQRAPGAPWRRLEACRADGTPVGPARACVDRRVIPGTSSRQVPHSGGDAILVVRTTVTSRWVGHRTIRR